MTYLKMTAQSSTGKFGKANSTSGTKGKILYILENFIVQAEDKLNGWRHVAVYIPDTRSPSTRLTMEREAEEWGQSAAAVTLNNVMFSIVVIVVHLRAYS